MAVRLKDIARELGVSTVTVSKVLRGNHDVGPKTREMVLRRMKELDYLPNYSARALASGRTYSVGLVVPDLINPYFSEFAKYLRLRLRDQGRVLVLASSDEDEQLEQQEIKTLLARGVDALLLASCQQHFAGFDALAGGGTPCILVDRNFPHVAAHFVGSDDVRVGELATEHLASLGRRRIAHIGTKRLSTGRQRLKGYKKVLSKHGLSLPNKYVAIRSKFEGSADVAGYHAMLELLRLANIPDAVFCYNDLTAIGAMHAAREKGFRIPDDLAFVGCGNFKYSDYLATPLTSVDHSPDQLGSIAGELAQALIDDPKQPFQIRMVEPRLIIRASTCLPALK